MIQAGGGRSLLPFIFGKETNVTQLIYTEAELARDHAFASPHEAGGHRLHGGFDEAGAYVSPRLAVRGPAVAAWPARLRGDGWVLIDADAKLLTTPP